ncbi:MAG: hypothetical protein F4087_04440 [Gemmatimonadetes bacterium]|nr:hypothetical protein [Gemmatimonadota bacterium]MYJ67750.1 hypothetical protein [Gemmatimonadota bacterium]
MALPTGPVPDRVLLVEGRDDRYVVDHIRRRSPPLPDFEIVDKGGIDPLLASIGVELKAPGRQAVGIIVDANDDIEARWSAVKDRVSRAGIALGDRDPNGTVVRGAALEPDVGLWIMPDNRSPGELEDFIADMIPKDDSVWPLSRAYIDGIPAESRLFNPKKEKRAKVHAWLAARERPRPMGLAIRAGDLEVGGDLCTQLATWLRQLFGPSADR